MKDSVVIVLYFLWSCILYAQDPMPKAYSYDLPLQVVEMTDGRFIPARLIPVENCIPTSFSVSRENVLWDETSTLSSFFDKLKQCNQPVRVVHIGDSHIRGHILTRTVRHNFERDFGSDAVYRDSISYFTSGLARETGNPGIVYHALGINGATCANFTNPAKIEEIAALMPDLIILSFGTNESHSRTYHTLTHQWEMDRLIHMLKEFCPECTILLTTPPGSYVRSKKTRVINTRTPMVASSILEYAQRNKIACWDLYGIVGGEKKACTNWLNGDYYQRDRIHFKESGYELQGNLLYEALIKAYNDYVVN